MKSKDYRIISHLRKNARVPLTKLSRETSIPVSTIFDRIKANEENIIVRHTTLIDFSTLGFHTRAHILVKVSREFRAEAGNYLQKHPNINSVFRINNGFDYMFEAVFRSIVELEGFIEKLDQKFKIEEKETYYIVEDIKKEEFMAEPDLLSLVTDVK
ncbi:TPA: Lrp/AsnC family transcriptional regulator [Candidatus Woesearchaeota archaeon]|nr:Transcriptional regulator, AsnC family [archaeon GW2011_AR15]MBS3104378.1 Lrp/AsnC family transcriptional regulator [Candidatus Woesearchaeota archaeon]HIH41309.1 Lrp/AsnC family transcriptional regulator [Candidatus Woesearchaeota archaeon]